MVKKSVIRLLNTFVEVALLSQIGMTICRVVFERCALFFNGGEGLMKNAFELHYGKCRTHSGYFSPLKGAKRQTSQTLLHDFTPL